MQKWRASFARAIIVRCCSCSASREPRVSFEAGPIFSGPRSSSLLLLLGEPPS